jgi:hypothetical protein
MSFHNHDTGEFPDMGDSTEVIGYGAQHLDDDFPTGMHENTDNSDRAYSAARRIQDKTQRWTIGLLAPRKD